MPNRLPVLKLALLSYRLAWRAAPAIARFVAIPIALLLIVEGGFRHAAQIAETWVDVTILDSILTVLGALIAVPVSVAAYRLFLFGRAAVSGDAVDDFPPGTGPVAVLSAIFAVASLPFFDMLILMEHEEALMPSVALAYHGFAIGGWVVGMMVTVRTLFLYVQAIKGRDLNISLAWRQTAGNGWRLFGLIFLMLAPAGALVLLVDSVTLEPLGGEVDFGLWQVWLGIMAHVMGDIAMAVLVASASVLAYAHITGFPIATQHGEAPVQPSLPFDAWLP